jgi:hypothetical protein
MSNGDPQIRRSTGRARQARIAFFEENMKDSEFKKHKKRVEKVADKWLSILGLKWWDINVNYVEESMYSRHTTDETQVAMTCAPLWQYMTAEIDVSIPVIALLDDADLERDFIHECAHILVCEMRSGRDKENHEERVCQMLTKAFLWVEELSSKDE